MTPHCSFTDTAPTHPCEHPGCSREAAYRAPKSKSAGTDYAWYCLEHIRIVNAQWDFLANLSRDQIERYIRNATVWERPTWPFGKNPAQAKTKSQSTRQPNAADLPAPIVSALRVLKLTPPVSWASIKAQYRVLVKQHHPDTGGHNARLDQFHATQRAFEVLRAYFQKQARR